MEYIKHITWMAGQALSLFSLSRSGTLVLVIGFAISLAATFWLNRSGFKFKMRYLLVLLPLAVTLLILVLGALMAQPADAQSPPPEWPAYAIETLLVIQLLVSIWVVWTMKGYRWLSFFTVALELFFALWCAFVATMSVTGDWL